MCVLGTVVRNVDIREKLQQEGVLDMVKSRQVKWKARLENMSMEKTTKKTFNGEMQGKTKRKTKIEMD